MAVALASLDDVATVWRLPTADETVQVLGLINVASAKLRQAAPFDIDARIALHSVTPSAATALDPVVVASVVAMIVKRVLVNPDGLATSTESVGPFSESRSFVARADTTGADTRGGIYVTASDVDQLRPAVLTRVPRSLTLAPTDRMAARGPAYLEVAPGVYSDVGVQYDPVTGEPIYMGQF
jgi:hypothetical protein